MFYDKIRKTYITFALVQTFIIYDNSKVIMPKLNHILTINTVIKFKDQLFLKA